MSKEKLEFKVYVFEIKTYKGIIYRAELRDKGVILESAIEKNPESAVKLLFKKLSWTKELKKGEEDV